MVRAARAGIPRVPDRLFNRQATWRCRRAAFWRRHFASPPAGSGSTAVTDVNRPLRHPFRLLAALFGVGYTIAAADPPARRRVSGVTRGFRAIARTGFAGEMPGE
jgi:hypothetical protein